MRCRFCDSELPHGALFCGECGRAVLTGSAGAAPTTHPIVARPLTVAAPPPEPGVSVATGSLGAIVDACEQCGSALAPSDIFCGECGFVARGIDNSETQVMDWVEDVAGIAPSAAAPPEPAGGVAAQPRADSFDSAGRVAAQPRADSVDSAGRVAAQPRADSFDSAGRVAAQPRIETPPSSTDDPPEPAPSFILQFSTGESATVSGSGLIGRNPRPEPGEFFDTLLTVSDPSRSVSKTHLEFGHEGGEFWIRDRYSGNGTVLRGPDAPIAHVVADRRYRVPRGSRVDMGDQFFIVS